MRTQPPRLVIALGTLLVVVGLPALLWGVGGFATSPTTDAAPPAQVVIRRFAVQGTYVGLVKLSDVVAGHYADGLATPTPAPGAAADAGKLGLETELSLYLDGDARVNGFVVLDRSLVFPQVSIIQATPVGPTPLPGTPPPGATPLAIGPRVTGGLDGDLLTLESEPFTVVLAPERIIPAPVDGGPAPAQRAPEQRAQRQFRLIGTLQSDGSLIGEYRETVQRTVDGLPSPPSTAIGQFTLKPQAYNAPPTPRPTPLPQNNQLYLPLIYRGRS